MLVKAVAYREKHGWPRIIGDDHWAAHVLLKPDRLHTLVGSQQQRVHRSDSSIVQESVDPVVFAGNSANHRHHRPFIRHIEFEVTIVRVFDTAPAAATPCDTVNVLRWGCWPRVDYRKESVC